MNALNLQRAVDMVMGRRACDMALVHASVVDVFGREILENRTVLVGDGHILAALADEECKDVQAGAIFDCQGQTLLPGLMDAHVHIESTMLTPPSFARAVLACGTTRVVADPHEIANVAGSDGIRYMLEASRDLPCHIHIALPSCVPCTPFEDAGASLDAGTLSQFWQEERVCSLGEVMNVPGVLAGDGDLLDKIAMARASGRMVDGHCPGLSGRGLQAYAACGMGNDHEEEDPKVLQEHVRSGLYVFVREGSAAKSLARVLPSVNEKNAHRFCLCTDDLHAEDILTSGHINAILRKAVALGLDAPTAVAMATINTASCFGFRNAGAIAPGYVADLVLADNVRDFNVARVWSEGKLVCEHGRFLGETKSVSVPESILHSVHIRERELDQSVLALPVPSKRARVIGLLPHSLCTEASVRDVVVDSEGNFDAAANPGLCKIAVFERHKSLGLVGLGILENYALEGRLLRGALATSIAHDSHNIVVAGSSDQDMIQAVARVAEMNGGIAIVQGGVCTASLPLPVAGLMSGEAAEDVARELAAIEKKALDFAVNPDIDPVVTLSFMALCVFPKLRVHTRGLFDVTEFSFTSVDAGDE